MLCAADARQGSTSALCICFSDDGKLILSGWSDGCVRALTPETGRVVFTVQGAHSEGVASLAILSSPGHRGEPSALLTGGVVDGKFRSWTMPSQYSLFRQKVPGKPNLLCTVKEHSGTIVGIQITKDQKEGLTTSKDGSCIIWDLRE